ncbi:AMP-binding protein [Aestuariirhabdus sp. LZHN29]|uniref:AMP-binding protein n=1 Tax=Aestuariirhabdus sp. LZHN29 TaxID=3417462 RepID=UPI003CEBF0CF
MAELTDPLAQAAARHGPRPALIDGAHSLSFAELHHQSQVLATQLAQQGVRRGDHLLLIDEHNRLTLRTLWATCLLGCVVIPLNPSLPPAQLDAQLATAQPRWLIGQNYRGALPPGCHRLSLDAADLPAPRVEFPPLDPHAPLTGTFTSGSSGNPKLALHSLANHHYSAAGSNHVIPLKPGEGWGLTLPLYHIGGLAILFRCLLAGAALVLGDRRDLDFFLRHPKVTHLSAVATQLIRLQRQGHTLGEGSLRHLLLGGSAFPQALLDWLQKQTVQCHISYGLTEMSSQVMTGPLNPESRILSELPHRQLRIAAPAGEEGEILLRGQTLWLGYYLDGELQRPLDPEGWFHTRDRGQLDKTGALKVIGRLDNQFVSGGENVQPEPLEAIIRQFGGIDECYLVPVPDAEYGARAVCFVEPFPADGGTALGQWLQSQLASHQRPRAFYPIPAELRSGLKISRQHLSRWAQQQV